MRSGSDRPVLGLDGDPEQIQTAVRFARDRRLRPVTKNTGHDLTGRPSAPGSFQIATHRLKYINYAKDFNPVGSKDEPGVGPAVTLGGGILGGELYEAAAAGGYTAIAGLCMTAEGKIVTANEYQNTDLFWALRGGGGGTFGVVVDVTVRVYPATTAVHVTMDSNITAVDEDFWTVVSELYAAIPKFSANRNFVKVDFISTVGSIFDSGDIPYTSSSEFIEQISTKLAANPGFIYGGGIGTLHGSVLISESYAFFAEGPAQMATAFSKLQLRPGDGIQVASMVTGKVRENGATVQSAIHPSFREALLFVDLVLGLSSTSSAEEQAAVQNKLTHFQMPQLYALEDHRMASYYNIGNPGEPDFRQAFWGKDNYERFFEQVSITPQPLTDTAKNLSQSTWWVYGRILLDVPYSDQASTCMEAPDGGGKEE
ncbi:uncharacterized protein ATNIH1004_006650 [Aspergillus tanneri]|uniref:FAD-binding PCMH-type domain-containing protein n=1 Tax=Aspergillus tanneri TaxID=1220188 RepID=A0A5M9ME72_9EURO|nr:uncharacterized protein ATNIH1004_006650 [Aspergillus tanneri]KAA8645231.1 hypothetical protein ATNIH1004_006650 [Aspergillus tanneri]